MSGTPAPEVMSTRAVKGQHLHSHTRPALPAAYEAKSVYIFGIAPNTPCGVRQQGSGSGARLKLVGTTRGDGTVGGVAGQ